MESKNHRLLEQALLMLETVADAPQGLTLGELCARLAIPKSTAHLLAHTFTNMGYMARDDDSKRFCLGIKAFETGSRFAHHAGADGYARRVLDDLVAQTGETAHLAVLDSADVVYICKSDCSHAVRMISQTGKRVPAHATAVGKALLSMETDEAIRRLYQNAPPQKLTGSTLAGLDELFIQLKAIRAGTAATESEESTPGVCCIALPVQGQAAGGRAGVSVSVPVARLGDGLQRFLPALAAAAARLQAIF